MRLYLSGISKNHIGYTPDTLIIENNGKHYEYDIGEGETDYSPDNLDSRTKGILNKRKDTDDEECYADYDELYGNLTEEDEHELLKLLADKESDIIVAVFPRPEDTDMYENKRYQKLVNTDIITDTTGLLVLAAGEVEFSNFRTEFYGF